MELTHRLLLITCLFLISHPIQAKKIQFIKIYESGKSRDRSEALTCKKFKPTIDQVRNFFTKARPTEEYILSHERYSPCYAAGILKFNDGNYGKWKLSSSGVATLIFSKGGVATLLYKKNKWHDPFACTYGNTDDGVC
jgi:hypothetical protein